jgi:hypothetical protein
MLLDYLIPLIFGSTATGDVNATGIASAEAFGLATLTGAHDIGNPSPATTITGTRTARPVFGSATRGISGRGSRGVR